MVLRFRFLFLILMSFFKKFVDVMDQSTLKCRVLFNDVDIKIMSSDRYLPIMDLGRINIILQAGLLKKVIKNRWIPVSRVVAVRYKSPLKLFQHYLLTSKIIYWDDEWVWTEHRFERQGKVTAIGISKITFVGPKGKVPIADVITAYGKPVPKIDMPNIVKELMMVEHSLTLQS